MGSEMRKAGPAKKERPRFLMIVDGGTTGPDNLLPQDNLLPHDNLYTACSIVTIVT